MTKLFKTEYLFWWALVFGILFFLPLHTTNEIFQKALGVEKDFFVAVKKVFFTLGLFLAAFVLWQEWQFFVKKKQDRLVRLFLKAMPYALLAMVVIAFLQWPYLGLRNSGVNYAHMMVDPFDQNAGFFYRRLLPIVFPYYLGAVDPISYSWFAYFYVFLFLLVSFCVITRFFSAWSSFEQFLLLLSLATPIVVFSYCYPGYPEPLALAIYLLSLVCRMRLLTRMVLMFLVLSCSDSMLFFVVPFEFFLHRNARMLYASLFYGVWGGVALLVLKTELIPQLEVSYSDGTAFSALSFFYKEPLRLLKGILFSQKILWGICFFFLWQRYFKKEVFVAKGFNDPWFFRLYGLGLMASLAIVLIAMDTSRLANAVIFFIAYAFYALWRSEVLSKRTLILILLLNMLFPSVQYFVHTGFEPGRGFYHWLVTGSFTR